MKITKKILINVIKEELSKALEEGGGALGLKYSKTDLSNALAVAKGETYGMPKGMQAVEQQLSKEVGIITTEFRTLVMAWVKAWSIGQAEIADGSGEPQSSFENMRDDFGNFLKEFGSIYVPRGTRGINSALGSIYEKGTSIASKAGF